MPAFQEIFDILYPSAFLFPYISTNPYCIHEEDEAKRSDLSFIS